MNKIKFVAVALVFLSVVLFSGCITEKETLQADIFFTEEIKEESWYKNNQKEYEYNYLRFGYGDFYNKIPLGKQSSWYKSGKIKSIGRYITEMMPREINYNRYQSTGNEIYYYENGQVKKQGNIFRDRREGLWEGFFEDGSIKLNVNFHNGDLNGTYLTYHNQTQIHEQGTYLNGEKQGQWIQWFPNGLLEHKAVYDKGVVIKNIEWYSETGEQIY